MMRKILRPMIVASVALVGSGCMTMFNGTTQKVPVITYPIQTVIKVVDESGALVFEGPAPVDVTLKRGHEYEITASAPGYKPAQVRAVSEMTRDNMWLGACLNMFGGGVGLCVDIGSGALKEFDAEGIELTLLREKQAPAAQADGEPLRLVVMGDERADGSTRLQVF